MTTGGQTFDARDEDCATDPLTKQSIKTLALTTVNSPFFRVSFFLFLPLSLQYACLSSILNVNFTVAVNDERRTCKLSGNYGEYAIVTSFIASYSRVCELPKKIDLVVGNLLWCSLSHRRSAQFLSKQNSPTVCVMFDDILNAALFHEKNEMFPEAIKQL